MKYIIDKENKYNDEIVKHLKKYNLSHTGDRKNMGHNFYLVKNGNLVAGMKTYLSWDWARIGDIKYDSLDSLRDLINKACDIYKDDAVGIAFSSNFKSVVDDMKLVGFNQINVIKYSPKMSDYFYLELTNSNDISNNDNCIIVQEKSDEQFNQILEKETKNLKEKYNVKDSKGKLTVVALDGDKFVGGVVGIVYDDHVYIDLLVVHENYRKQSIGTKLMNKLEQELSKDIVTISLGTVEFQARGFYEKLGYKTIMTQKNFPKGFEAYTLIKNIDAKD